MTKRLMTVTLSFCLMVLGLVGLATPASAAPGNILPPFNVGETWNICQGYSNPAVTHTGTSQFGLDLTGGGCGNSAAGRTARAPADGTVYYYQASYGNLCVNMPGGKSYTLTHIDSSISSGVVTAGQAVGTVAAAGQRGNNGVAHIHFQMWATPNCYSSAGIPFDSGNGTRICGAPDLTAIGPNGGNGVWSGQSVVGSTCDGSGGSAASSTTSSSDIDKNGAADLVLTTNEPSGGSAATVALSTWEGFVAPQQWWGDPTVGWAGIKPLVGDVNGDKKSDYVFVANSGSGVRIYVALSTGSGFGIPQLWWNGDSYGYQGSKVLMGDVDGNGATDVVFVRPDGGGGTVVNVSLSTWQGFLSPQQWWASPDYGFANITPMLGDARITINPVKQKPDGAVDLVLMTDFGAGGTRVYVLASSGTSFVTPVLWWSEASYAYADLKPVMGDVDGNGAADLVLVRKLNNGGTEARVALSTWEGFIAMTTWWTKSDYGWDGVTPLVGDVKITIDPVKQAPDKAADLVLLTNEGAAGTKAWVAVSSRSSFVGSELWWHGVGWGYDGIKANLG